MSRRSYLGKGATTKASSAFLATTIGQTAVMAVTGVFLYLYVLSHLIGNLLVYAGREQINTYAAFLHSHYAMLWTARALLLAAVVIHIAVGARLWWLGRHVARPVPYFMKKDVPPAYASKTMMRSGSVILVFVVFHVLHLTTGSLGLPFRELDIYGNLTAGFHILWVSGIYIVAMVFLGMHLYHGLWTIFPYWDFRTRSTPKSSSGQRTSLLYRSPAGSFPFRWRLLPDGCTDERGDSRASAGD